MAMLFRVGFSTFQLNRSLKIKNEPLWKIYKSMAPRIRPIVRLDLGNVLHYVGISGIHDS